MQLTGELSKVNLPNLLRLVKNGELTGKITLSQGANTASIFVQRGNVIHVETDQAIGKEALMELFLWQRGSFSFNEESTREITPTFHPSSAEDSTESILKDGLSYLEQKQYLDRLQVTGQTLLNPTETAWQKSPQFFSKSVRNALPVLSKLDGQISLSEALASVNLSRRAFVDAIATLLNEGLATIVDAPSNPERTDAIALPEWVIARLEQDDPDVCKAIVDMVIWVDRVKCWMYQADADFARLLDDLIAVGELKSGNEQATDQPSDKLNAEGIFTAVPEWQDGAQVNQQKDMPPTPATSHDHDKGSNDPLPLPDTRFFSNPATAQTIGQSLTATEPMKADDKFSSVEF